MWRHKDEKSEPDRDRDEGYFRRHHNHRHHRDGDDGIMVAIYFTNTISGERIMSAVTLDTAQKVSVTAVPVDHDGNTVAWVTGGSWTSSNEATASLVVSENTYSVEIVSGSTGASDVEVSTTLADGSVLTAVLNVTVVDAPPPPAVAINFEVQAPVAK